MEFTLGELLMLTSISTKSSVQDSLKAISQDPYNLFLSVFSLDTANTPF